MNIGLLLIDIQNDYFLNGKCALYQSEQAVYQAEKILSLFREHGRPIFHVQHINNTPNAAFFMPNTAGVEIHKSVFPQAGEVLIEKHAPDSFFETDLQKELDRQQVNHLVVCGMMTHMCVDTTVRAARNFGYSVTLIEDACATKDLEWNDIVVSAPIVQTVFLAALHNSFAKITTADKWQAEMNR